MSIFTILVFIETLKLWILRNTSAKQMNIVRKGLCRFFKSHNFSVSIRRHMTKVNILDDIFNLTTGLVRPFLMRLSAIRYTLEKDINK